MDTDRIVFEEGVSVLKRIREALEMSQEEFARAVDMSTQVVSRCERGKTEPRFTLAQIKKLLPLLEGAGVEVSDLPDKLSF